VQAPGRQKARLGVMRPPPPRKAAKPEALGGFAGAAATGYCPLPRGKILRNQGNFNGGVSVYCLGAGLNCCGAARG